MLAGLNDKMQKNSSTLLPDCGKTIIPYRAGCVSVCMWRWRIVAHKRSSLVFDMKITTEDGYFELLGVRICSRKRILRRWSVGLRKFLDIATPRSATSAVVELSLLFRK